MVRPVSGYITAQGKYCETQEQAEMYEATYDIQLIVGRSMLTNHMDAADAFSLITTLIKNNYKEFRRYIECISNAKLSLEQPAASIESPSHPADEDIRPPPSPPS